jgi:AraC-like DNA-binding protein
MLRAEKGEPAAHAATLAYEFESAHVIPEHFHPEDQLVYACKGVMTVRTQQGIWVVPPLRAVWIPARVPHSIAMSGMVAMRTLYFNAGMVRALGRQCTVINVTPLLRELLLHACNFPRLSKERPTQRRILELITDQLKEAHAVGLQLPHPTDTRAARVARLLVADPATRASLEELCKQCGASKRTIQRTFIAETNLTFEKWRRQLRLLHAMRVLASGAKVTSVAIDAGYDSPSAFISMFKKQLGTTPTRYFKPARHNA